MQLGIKQSHRNALYGMYPEYPLTCDLNAEVKLEGGRRRSVDVGYFFFTAAHRFLCASAIRARPSALIVFFFLGSWLALRNRPRPGMDAVPSRF